MRSWFPSTLLALAAAVHGATVWQQRNVSFETPVASLGVFPSNFTSKSEALTSFEAAFGSSKIARGGDTRYGATIARVWTEQRKTWPELILYPETAQDVSVIMQFYSAAHGFWGNDGFAISKSLLNSLSASIDTADSKNRSGWWSCRFRRCSVSQRHY